MSSPNCRGLSAVTQSEPPGKTGQANQAGQDRLDKGMVLQIQSMSVNDGEGIRTVIFLPGCPLRCRWCSNPETWTPFPKLAVYPGKCVECGACRTACPLSLFPPHEAGDRAGECLACGACASVCPSGALTVLIREMTVADVVRRVERDAVFFRNSGGGVTFSGGEPTFQAGFLRSLVLEFERLGIDMCMETCGHFHWDAVSDILAKLNHVLYDCKHMDALLHKELTGVSNASILDNCVRLHGMGIPITIRIPTIKGVTGSVSNLKSAARFIGERVPGASVELLPYHDLGNEKYSAIGQGAKLHEEYAAPDAAAMEEAENIFRRAGVTVVRYR